MSPFYAHGNAGVVETRVTTSDVGSGDAWTAVEDSAACPFKYTDQGHADAQGNSTGGYAYGTDGTGSAAARAYKEHETMAEPYGCFYIKILAAVGTSTRVLQWRNAAGAANGPWIFLTTSETMQLRDNALGTSWTGAQVLSLDTRYRVEHWVAPAGATASARVWIYLGDSTTVLEDSGVISSIANGSFSTIGRIYVGSPITVPDSPSAGGFVFLDDIVLFNSVKTGPIISNQAQTQAVTSSNLRW